MEFILILQLLFSLCKDVDTYIEDKQIEIEQTQEIENVVSEFEPIELQKIRITCYVATGNRTASGDIPYEGGCASNWAHMGDTAILFDEDMNYIGEFIVNDVGGAKSLKNGTSIDLFKNDLQSAKNFIKEHGDFGYIIWLKK